MLSIYLKTGVLKHIFYQMSDKLIDKLLKASESIHISATRGSANYIVASQSVGDIIQEAYSKQRSGFRKEKIMRIFNEETQS